MEGEVNKLILVWTTVLASLIYCHTISKFVPKGTTRLFSFLPVIALFIFLPLNFTSLYFTGLTSFFVSWLANFKLIFFAFDEGPLFSNPPIALHRFIPTACLPIQISKKTNSEKNASKFEEKEIVEKNPSQDDQTGTTKKSHKKSSYATKIMLFCLLLKVSEYYQEYMHPTVKTSFYCFHIYFILELILAMAATLTRTLVRVELEPQFDAPHRATSVQNFWGKRWNLMVSNILRATVYQPVRSIAGRFIAREWVSVPAVFATFLVSGIMHELIFYHMGRLKPTGEFTAFFVIQGVWVAIEIIIKKKASNRKLRLPAIVSRPLTLGFVLGTCSWLFFPPFLRFNPVVRGCKETIAFIEFFTHGRYVSSYEVSCPYVK